MDFSGLGKVGTSKKPTDPIKIFEQLPNLPGTPNDIWRGQTEALKTWDEKRNNNDILVELNTGAGKTLVGLLIAQSLVNEGCQNVVYVCATIDLVLQTSFEASKIGIDHTTRTSGKYNNDLFECGKSFCITTYHALFNSRSVIRRKNFPEAIIFDDAHVSEGILRSAFTLNFSLHSNKALFSDIAQLFEDHFRDLDRHGEFLNAIGDDSSKIVMAAPDGVRERKDRIINCLRKHGVDQDNDMSFPFQYIQDKIDRCAVLFGNKCCEITPPFLPSLTIDCLERPIRRVYLSATLKSKSDFIRAYGRLPDVTISPKNDAGNGERLVLFGSNLENDVDANLASKIASNKKVIIATPSYLSAEAWSEVATPPTRDNFTPELENFRKANSGSFLLVQRVDGIDLPHDCCRIMVMEGLPKGGSLLERFQWEFLNMKNLFASKMANRLAQLFGRINRGRNDYGVFLLSGKEINTWLKNDRNLALLPDLIQQQIKLGEEVQAGMSIKSEDDVCQIINSVLAREPTWLDYYGENIKKGEFDSEKTERAFSIEEKMTQAALAESAFAKAVWERDFETAYRAIEETIEETLRADTCLAGWHSIWEGACYSALNDFESAGAAYTRAKSRLGSSNLYLPTFRREDSTERSLPLNKFGEFLDAIVGCESEDRYKSNVRKLEERVSGLNGGSSGVVEASLRELGEMLGFESTRPDNDFGTGPDVLWVSKETNELLHFELKTDKGKDSLISKKDIGQGHQHQEWVYDNYPKLTDIGLLYVSEATRIDKSSSPSEGMGLIKLSDLLEIRNSLFALFHDLRRHIPLERRPEIEEQSNSEKWKLNSIYKELNPLKILDQL